MIKRELTKKLHSVSKTFPMRVGASYKFEEPERHKLRFIKRAEVLTLQEKITDDAGISHWQDVPVEEEY